jgi:integrase
MSKPKQGAARSKPETVKVGNVLVKIYQRSRPTTTGGKRSIWEVADYTGGFRRMHSFSDFAQARREAERIAGLLSKGEATAANLRNSEAAEYGNAVAILRNANLRTSLQTVADRYVEAVKILGTENIVEAAKFYAKRNPATREPKSVQAVAGELVELKQNRKASVRYLADLKARLNTVARQFPGDIAMVTTGDLQKWFDSMDSAPRTVRNFRNTAGALFKYAEARGYIAKGENPVLATETIKAKNASPIEIYTPEEIGKLLKGAPEDFKPIVALQAFAGLRSAEVMRLDWQHVRLVRGHIEITAGNAKTASRRIVPILPNLAAWLKDHVKTTGLVFETGNASTFNNRQHETAQNAKVPWKANALRHSFISYRVAETQNVAQVALEAGNSPGMIFGHYRELVTGEDAKTWFATLPEQPGNIVDMPKSAAA